MNRHAPPAATAAATLPLGVRLPREFAFWVGWLLLGLLVFSAATLAWRRWAGALVAPPPPMSLLAVGLVAAAVAASARQLHGRRVMPWLPSVALVLLGLAMTFRGTSLVVVGGFWAVLVAEEAWSFRMRIRRRTNQSFDDVSPRAERCPAPVPASAEADHVVQHFQRTQGRDGTEAITGWLRIPLAAGQRTASAHVAFCPPLARVPAWEVEQVEGPGARVRTTQLMAYGARMELKLDASPAEPVEIVVRFDGRTEG